MCLSKITDRPSPTPEVTTTWKAFSFMFLNELQFPTKFHKGIRSVERGKWLRKEGSRIKIHNSDIMADSYPAGFHCFASEKAANEYSTESHAVKVLVKKIRTVGYQSHYGPRYKALVADWLYVPAPNEKIVGNKIVKVK